MNIASLKRIGREAFWVGLGQAVAALGAIIAVRLLTGFMNPTAYGELALALTIGMLTGLLIMGPLGQPIGRFFAPMKEAHKLTVYFRAALLLLTQATGIVVLFAGLSILGLWVTGHARWIPVVFLAFLLALFNGFEGILDAVQNSARHRIVVAWHDSIGQWARSGMAILLIILLGSSGAAALMGYVLGVCLVLTSQIIFLKKLILKGLPWAADAGEIKQCAQQMRAYAWPFAGWGPFAWAQTASDRWALQGFAATGAVGLYTALFQIGYSPISLLTGLGVQLFAPILASWAGDASDPGRLKRAYRLNLWMLAGSLALTTVATLIAVFFHNFIFRLALAPQYRQLAGWLPYMVVAGGLFASGQILSLIFQITGHTKRLLAPKIGASILCVLLNIAGAYRYGIPGVVFANVIFSLVYLIWVLILARRQMQESLALGAAGAAWRIGGAAPSAT